MNSSTTKRFIKTVAFPYRALRSFNRIRTTQHFIIGYPRSGNTWTKFLLGRYLQLLFGLDEMPLFNHYDFWGRCDAVGNGYRINSSHGGLNWSSLKEDKVTYEGFIKRYEGKKVALLTRYPLDSLVSNWLYYKHLSHKYKDDIEMFLKDPLHSVKKWINYHNLWANTKTQFPDDIALLRYEDLRADTRTHFGRLLSFLEVPVEKKVLQSAIEFASLENMKGIQEEARSLRSKGTGRPTIRVGVTSDPESRHVRKGKVGGYRDYMEPSIAKEYESLIAADLDDWFGYATPPQSQAD